jgi:hypothetical protein
MSLRAQFDNHEERLQKIEERLACSAPSKTGAASERGGIPIGHYWVWYDGSWMIGEWDGEDWELENGVTCPSYRVVRGHRIADPPDDTPIANPTAHFSEQTRPRQDPPTLGVGYIDPKVCGSFVRADPPTPEALIEEAYDLAQAFELANWGNLDEDAPARREIQAFIDHVEAYKVSRHRIGVYDYASLVSCLRTNYKMVFGSDSALTDPQDMVQRMTAEIQNLRRHDA